MEGGDTKKVPPARNTGVLIEKQPFYRYSIDWLRYSLPYHYALEDVLPQWDKFVWSGETGPALPNYTHAAILESGRVDWNPSRPEQKKLITLTGDNLQELINHRYAAQVLVEWITRQKGLKVSRLDFAVDCYNFGGRPQQVYRKHRQGKCQTRAKKATLINATEGKESKGQTCYIGTRASMKYLRVYDKAAESKEPGDWIRIEIELKDEYALTALHAMARHGIIEGGKAVMRKYIETGLEWFDNAMKEGEEGVYVEPVEHKLTDWETWVINVALPAVQEAMWKRTPGVRDGVISTLKGLYYGHGKPGKPTQKPERE